MMLLLQRKYQIANEDPPQNDFFPLAFCSDSSWGLMSIFPICLMVLAFVEYSKIINSKRSLCLCGEKKKHKEDVNLLQEM